MVRARQEVSMGIGDLEGMIKKPDPINIIKYLMTEYIAFLSGHGTFIKTDYMLVYIMHVLVNFKQLKTVCLMIMWNYARNQTFEKITRKPPSVRKLSNTHLNNSQVKEKESQCKLENVLK